MQGSYRRLRMDFGVMLGLVTRLGTPLVEDERPTCQALDADGFPDQVRGVG
jgi:hypothetical protein